MSMPPIDKSFMGTMKDWLMRLTLVERRLASGAFSLPGRLQPQGQQVTDWNLAVETGFYWSEAAALNNPVGNVAVGFVLVKPVGSNPRVFQEVYFPSTGATNIVRSWRRVNSSGDGSGTWSAWTEFGGGYSLYQTVYFTSSGSFTKASYTGIRAVRVKVQAGGGAGGSCTAAATGQNSYGSGGGGGGYAESWILEASLAASVTVTVGAGGTATSTDGNSGGNSSFGTAVVATGGAGGIQKGSSTLGGYTVGGAGGSGTAGDLQLSGGGGSSGWGAATLAASGVGGPSVMGGGGRSQGTGAGGGSNVGQDGGNYGGGASGAAANAAGAARNGGVGGPGIVIVEVYR